MMRHIRNDSAEAMTPYILMLWAGINVGFLLGAAWLAITSAR
jgi:hypothetical protein